MVVEVHLEMNINYLSDPFIEKDLSSQKCGMLEIDLQKLSPKPTEKDFYPIKIIMESLKKIHWTKWSIYLSDLWRAYN